MTTALRLVLRALIIWAIEVVAFLVMIRFVPGVTVQDWRWAVLAVLVVALLNVFVRPVILLLSTRLGIFPFLLIPLLLNAVLVVVAAWMLPGFHVDGLWTAFLLAVGLAVLNAVFTAMLSIDDDDSFYRNVIRRLARRDSLSPASGVRRRIPRRSYPSACHGCGIGTSGTGVGTGGLTSMPSVSGLGWTGSLGKVSVTLGPICGIGGSSWEGASGITIGTGAGATGASTGTGTRTGITGGGSGGATVGTMMIGPVTGAGVNGVASTITATFVSYVSPPLPKTRTTIKPSPGFASDRSMVARMPSSTGSVPGGPSGRSWAADRPRPT